MAKILLVEDDNNLREIYEARLQAEGYTIVSAMDGEEALVIAKKEKPDLIISDVMMPRISGFEMLDILRNTEGLKNVRVIMLTALGQAEDKTRADALGADRYLVKSQVTLEDIVKAAQELIGPTDDSGMGATAPATPATTPAPQPQEANTPVTPAAAVAPAPAPPIPVATPPNVLPSTPPPTTPAPQPQATTAAVTQQPQPVSAPAVPAASSPQLQSAPSMPASTPTIPTPTPPTTLSAEPSSTVSTAMMPTPASARISEPTTPAQSTASTQPESNTPLAPLSAPEIAPTPAPIVPQASSATTETPATTPTVPQSQTPVIPPEHPISSTQPETKPNDAKSNSSDAQTTSHEQEAIRSQIENFVSQNSQTAPAEAKTADESIMADAIKNLVTDSKDTSQPKPPAEPKIIQPPLQPSSEGLQNTGTIPGTPSTAPTTIVTPTTTPPSTANLPSGPPATSPVRAQNDGVAIAHKKIISPIPGSVQEPPDLNALLAKEGISSLDDDDEQNTAPTDDIPAPSVAPLPPTPTDVPSMPHQPGHVITPSGQSVDPNTISL